MQHMQPAEWLRHTWTLQFVCDRCYTPVERDYDLPKTRKWVKRWAPLLKFSARVITVAATLCALPVNGVVDGAINGVLDGLDGLPESSDAGDDEEDEEGEEDEEDESTALVDNDVPQDAKRHRRLVGAAHRRLAKWVLEHDKSFPESIALDEVETAEGKFEWLCKSCQPKLTPTAPQLAAAKSSGCGCCAIA